LPQKKYNQKERGIKMKKLLLRRLVYSSCVAVLILFITGCEEDADMRGVSSYFDEHPYESTKRDRPSPAKLSIEPLSATLNADGETKVFTASGGRKPYIWKVSDISRGSIVSEATSQAVYQRNAPGDNVVIVSDQDGNSVVATVKQP
jgi:hypothetical protein